MQLDGWLRIISLMIHAIHIGLKDILMDMDAPQLLNVSLVQLVAVHPKEILKFMNAVKIAKLYLYR